MADQEERHWVILNARAGGVVVNPVSSHYENAVRRLEEIFRVRPPHDHDLLAAPHSCAEAIENMFGHIARQTATDKPRNWKAAFETLGVEVGPRAVERLAILRRTWNQDKHGGRKGDAVAAFQTATPEFAVDAVNLTGALLAAFFFKSDGSRAKWIRRARVVGDALELGLASDPDQREMMAAWEISVAGF